MASWKVVPLLWVKKPSPREVTCPRLYGELVASKDKGPYFPTPMKPLSLKGHGGLKAVQHLKRYWLLKSLHRTGFHFSSTYKKKKKGRNCLDHLPCKNEWSNHALNNSSSRRQFLLPLIHFLLCIHIQRPGGGGGWGWRWWQWQHVLSASHILKCVVSFNPHENSLLFSHFAVGKTKCQKGWGTWPRSQS